MKRLIPTKRQWDRWTLPSKHTSLGLLVGILALLLAILAFFPRSCSQSPASKELTGAMQRQLDDLYHRLKTPDTITTTRFPGWSLHLVAAFHRAESQRRKYIYDMGDSDRNRVSIYFDPDDSLTFRILDSTGDAYTLKTPVEDLAFDEFAYWVFEIGNRDTSSFMTTHINGKEVSRLELGHHLSLVAVDKKGSTLGADINGRDGATFDLSEMFIYSSTLTTEEQAKLLDYVRTKRRTHYVEFSGDQWMQYSDGAMKQGQPEAQPRFRTTQDDSQ